MNITRIFTGFISSSNPRKWDRLRSTFALRPSLLPAAAAAAARHYRRKAPEKADGDLHVDLPAMDVFSELRRPTVIPFQTKVANSVNIVGTIDSAVKLHQLPDGSNASVVILVNKNMEKPEDSPRFMIPVIFQGNLAEIAACHLKKNDRIYVCGRLSGDILPFMQNDTKENIKLIADSVNYVKETGYQKGGQSIHKQDEVSTSDPGSVKTSDIIDNTPMEFGGSGVFRKSTRSNFRDQLWMKLVENPAKWWDNRTSKTKATQPDFKNKDDGTVLWLNSAPSWVLPKLPPLPVEIGAAGK